MKSIVLKKLKPQKGRVQTLIEAMDLPEAIEKDINKSTSRYADREKQSYLNGRKKSPQSLYKYLNFDTAICYLSGGVIRFSQPTEWVDKYEQRFYTANYSDVTNNPKDTPRFLACCFTTNKVSEAAWKTYKYEKHGFGSSCVKFKINRSKLRDWLVRDPKINQLYEGFMNYSLSDYEILNLHRVGYPYHKEIFQSGVFSLEKYLSLMLLKRQAFYYEGEYRFMVTMLTKENEQLEKTYNVNVDWASIIEEIEVDKDCTRLEIDILKHYLREKKIGNDIIDNIKKVNLYEQLFGTIEIEK